MPSKKQNESYFKEGDMSYFPMFCKDFEFSTRGWSLAKKGAYISLLNTQWVEGRVSIATPSQEELLERIYPGILEHFEELKNDKFFEDEDGWKNPRLEKIREKVLQRAELAKERGKKGAKQRWQKDRVAIATPPDKHCLEDRVAIATPPDKQWQGKGKGKGKGNNIKSPPSVSRSEAKPGISWDDSAGFQGITDADRESWASAYPAADLKAELAKMHEWLLANPTRAHRKAWRRFVTSWLSKCQDSGGTHRGAAVASQRVLQNQQKRQDEWKKLQPGKYRRPSEAVALAKSLQEKKEELL